MKKFVSNFLLRGLVACGFGPVVLAAVYWVLHQQGVVQTLEVTEKQIYEMLLSIPLFVKAEELFDVISVESITTDFSFLL